MFSLLCFLLTTFVEFGASLPPDPILVSDRLHHRTASSTASTVVPTSSTPDAECTNGPFTRQCWGNGFSIATDFDYSWPQTGNTVSYTLEITNMTLAPDGYSREVFAVNGQYPGPTIRANWGDTLQITVTNSLQTNGTSIHWHGIRQWHTNQMDGTNGVTECPLAPGQSRTFTFLCTQFGTTWYHSHYSDQYTDGVLGPIIIDGPATANYDVDLGAMPITDWYYQTASQIGSLLEFEQIRAPPAANNVLINGTNVNLNQSGGGNYNIVTITKGKTYRLRLINTGTNDGYKVSLDGHNFTVITADFVPIQPFTTQWLFINIGQRYDVIFHANQNVDSYWFHAVVQKPCGNNLNTNALAIFTYAGSNTSVPTTGAENLPPSTDCNDPNSNLLPYVSFTVPVQTSISASSELPVGLNLVQSGSGQNVVQWTLNLTAMQVDWSDPTLAYVQAGNTSYPTDLNVIDLPDADSWSFWIIQDLPTVAPALPHPMHLHGHDMYILGTGTGNYTNTTALNFQNPPRRDVATLPAGGWMVLAFVTDNPGAWLMHCHISWHVGLGLAAQFLEQADQILDTITLGPDWEDQCVAWKAYYDRPAEYLQEDSGL